MKSAAVFLSVFLCPVVLLAERPAAVVVFAAGERALAQNGQNLDLEAQDLIYPGDEIETGADGNVSVQAFTGIIFHINPGTRIKIRDLASAASGESLFVELQHGTVGTIVSKGQSPAQVMIQTPTATASVRGTEFVVEAEEEGTTNVLVNEGEVQVEDPQGTRQSVRAGRMLRARLRERLAEEQLTDTHRRRMRFLEEFRSRRDEHFRERLEKIRAGAQRVRRVRQAIRRARQERREEIRENIRENRENRRNRN